MIKITVLVDNFAGRWARAEHGLSFWIELENGNQYLLDTGSTGLFKQNGEWLGIDVETAKAVILSHGHDDHTGGLSSISGMKLYMHPEAMHFTFRKSNGTSLGMPLSKQELNKRFDLVESVDPIEIEAGFWFLGEIQRVTSFEAKQTEFMDNDGNPDFAIDDSAIAIETEKGLVVISGCAHSGICNTVKYAQKITGVEKVDTIMGGFHLRRLDNQFDQTLKFFKDIDVRKVIPSHCTGLPVLSEIYKHFPFTQVKTGNTMHI